MKDDTVTDKQLLPFRLPKSTLRQLDHVSKPYGIPRGKFIAFVLENHLNGNPIAPHEVIEALTQRRKIRIQSQAKDAS